MQKFFSPGWLSLISQTGSVRTLRSGSFFYAIFLRPSPMTRAHHFKTKRPIASMAIESIERFLDRFAPPDGQDYFRLLWDGLGLDYPENERICSGGVSVESRELMGGQSVLVLTFPEPKGRNEAYFLAVLKPEPGVGFVVGLERSLNLMTQESSTALVGWSGQGRLNFGKCPKPDLESFILALEELLI